MSRTDLLADVLIDKPVTPKQEILHPEESVDVILANISLSGMVTSFLNSFALHQLQQDIFRALEQRQKRRQWEVER